MDTKTCKTCREDKPLSDFDTRRKPPFAHFNNCRTCQKAAFAEKPKASYYAEMAALRGKAKEFRKFTPEQDKQLLTRLNNGESITTITNSVDASRSAVYKAIQRARHA